MKRFLDILIAVAVLALSVPLLALAAITVRLSSPGPILHRARRSGLHGVPFEMLKFRSMHIGSGGSAITTPGDQRVFAAGRWLRRLKVDELPQFLNVLRGEMSIVGPRPEDPDIVTNAYNDWMRETLKVKPGITGPGSIYFYALGEAMVDPADPEGSYVRDLLQPKLAIDLAYIDRATPISDLVCCLHTVVAVLGAVAGRPVLPSRTDMTAAQRLVPIPARLGRQ